MRKALGLLSLISLFAAMHSTAAPLITIEGLQSSDLNKVNESGRPVAFTVFLEDPPTPSVTLTLTPSVADQVEILPAVTLTFDAAQHPETKTIIVRGIENTAKTANADFTLTLHAATSADAAYAALPVQVFNFSNENNDSATTKNYEPTAIRLLAPASSSKDVKRTTDFIVEHPFDSDGDKLTMTLCHDTSSAFTNHPVCTDFDESTLKEAHHRQRSNWALTLSGLLLLLGLRNFRWRRLLMTLSLIIFMSGCGSEKLMDSFRLTPRMRWVSRISTLQANTTYYWMVYVSDGQGHIVKSSPRSFQTGVSP
jgi:hypothetical protein